VGYQTPSEVRWAIFITVMIISFFLDQKIEFEDTGKICVIHGENNIGKSNLFEAMQLFFQLLCFNHSWFAKLSSEELAQLGFKANEIFSLDSESPITITAVLKIETSDLPRSQKPSPRLLKNSEIQFNIELQKAHNEFECQISPTFFDGTTKPDENDTNLLSIFRQSPMVLIGVDRRISENEIEAVRNLVPQTLLLKLYDMRDSLDTSIYKWELFVRTLQRFNDVLGEGEFVALFNRHTNCANLAFQPKKSKSGRIPIELLGSGIQQVVALVARLLVSNATFIAIEEPELN
jgi:AAA15 family ATPase/GTPase